MKSVTPRIFLGTTMVVIKVRERVGNKEARVVRKSTVCNGKLEKDLE